MVKEKGVSMKVNRKWFDETFEPARKELENQTGARVGQMNFTEFLVKKKIKIRLPKQKFNIRNKSIKNKSPLNRGFRVI